MNAWIGPAIVAAVISGLISLLVVQMNFRQERKADKLRREDLRDDEFRQLARDRQPAVYKDYLQLWKVWRELAEKAERALQAGAIQ